MTKIIAVGGVNGSGTRAVAQVLIDAGVHMGTILNKSNDNLIYSWLFRNPDWFKQASYEDIRRRYLLFQRHMEDGKMSLANYYQLFHLGWNNTRYKGRRKLFIRIYLDALKKREGGIPWGWKAPNTKLYYAETLKIFPDLKYIHVLRHGLDMAFSSNINQLQDWGYRYGLSWSEHDSKEQLARKLLDYWIASSREVREGSKAFEGRVFFLNHTTLSLQPEVEVDRMLQFCDLKVPEAKRKELRAIPRRPSSMDRYKKYDLGIFDQAQLDAVREFGFEI